MNNAWRPEKKLAVTPKRTRRLKCYRSLVASNFVQTVSPVAFFCSRVGNKKKKKHFSLSFLLKRDVTVSQLSPPGVNKKKKEQHDYRCHLFFFLVEIETRRQLWFHIITVLSLAWNLFSFLFFFPSGEYFIRLSRKAVLVVFSSENPLTLIQKKKVKVLNENEEGKKQKLWKNLARKKEDD